MLPNDKEVKLEIEKKMVLSLKLIHENLWGGLYVAKIVKAF